MSLVDGIQFEIFGREFAWLNNWYSVELAVNYYWWATVAFLGVLQTAAAQFRRPALAIIPQYTVGRSVGLLVWSGALLGFYVTQYPLLFVPGPATTEAVFILSCATLTALVLTRVVAMLRSIVWQHQADAQT